MIDDVIPFSPHLVPLTILRPTVIAAIAMTLLSHEHQSKDDGHEQNHKARQPTESVYGVLCLARTHEDSLHDAAVRESPADAVLRGIRASGSAEWGD